MPTGYTAMIEDDDCTDAREYVKKCSRAFGLFIHQRDDSLSADPTYPEVEDSYYVSALDRARVKLATVNAWDEEDILDAHAEYLSDAEASNARSVAKANRINGNYEKILADLAKWEPLDETSQNIKKFAIDQINMCYPDKAYIIHPETDVDKWYKAQIDYAMDNVNYYLNQLEKDRIRNIEKIAAIDTFFLELKRIPGVDGVPEVW